MSTSKDEDVLEERAVCVINPELCTVHPVTKDNLCAAGENLCTAGENLCTAGEYLCTASEHQWTAGEHRYGTRTSLTDRWGVRLHRWAFEMRRCTPAAP
jgi:hypothetical protein